MRIPVPIKIILLLLLSLTVLNACTNTSKDGVINFDITANIDNKIDINLSDIADSISYIPLETKPECLIAEPYLVKSNKDYFFISDGKKPLMVFNMKGEFVRNIGSPGKGPGEYTQCKEFAVNNDLQEIYILNANKEILAYKIDGEYLRSIKIPHDSYMFYELGSSGYLFYNIFQNTRDSAYFRFYFTDREFNFTKGIPQEQDSRPYFYPTFGASIYSSGNSDFAQFEANDTIYQITDYNPIPKIYLDFNKMRISQDQLEDFGNMDQHMINYVTKYEISSLGDNISIRFSNKGNLYLGIINPQKNKLVFAGKQDTNFSGLLNDIDGGPGFFPAARYSSSSWIKAIPAFKMKEAMENKDYNTDEIIDHNAYKKLRSITDVMDENDNPVIMLVHKKKKLKP